MKNHSKLFTQLLKIAAFSVAAHSAVAFGQCNISNDWYIPAEGISKTDEQVLPALPAEGFVLLGEHHANTAHHQWQLKIIKTLHQKQRDMVIGLEMLPRSSQAALDNWIAGSLTKEEFIQQSGWLDYWSFNFEDYYPILEYARQNKIPLIALNVSHQLLQGIKQVGWDAVPDNHREGVSNPAKPLKEYIRKLAKSFARHGEPDQPLDKTAFLHFLQQQLIWDRAMAEALSQASRQDKAKLVIGLMGSWHIIDKQGVPYQMTDLGHPQVSTLVPWSEHIDCDSVNTNFADAIYGMVKN